MWQACHNCTYTYRRSMRMIRILMNIKGGVGKTTTAINMGVGFSDLNKKTLLVDLDGQANSTFIILGKKIDKDQLSVAEAILDPSKTKDAILKTQYENLDILPSKLSLFNSERHVLMDVSGGQSAKVQKMLKHVEDQYDEIIIDCNPSRGILNTNAVYACKGLKGEVIIPILIDINAVDGFVNTVNFINEINEATDSNIEWKVLFTMFNRTKRTQKSMRI